MTTPLSNPLSHQIARRRAANRLIVDLVVSAVLIAIFGYMLAHSFNWRVEAALFPRVIAAIGILVVMAYAAQQVLRFRSVTQKEAGRILDIGWSNFGASQRAKARTFGIIASLILFWVGVWLIGFHASGGIYLFTQLMWFGNMRWWKAGLATAVFWAVVITVYDQLAGTTWNDPVLFDWVRSLFR